MNFKILCLLFIVAACGVKGDPKSPTSPAMPSLLENYSDIDTDKKLFEYKKP